ncbi:MAG TPA: SMC-Scp complex subunit ScpB [Polyangia bacterium]|nr:SMC-Scp complex subunit ScpB [Polyangia bacterium]
MKRGKKNAGVAEPQAEDITPAGEQTSETSDNGWDGPTRAGSEGEIAELAAESAGLEAEIDVAVGDAALDGFGADAAPSGAVEGEATVETHVGADGEILLAGQADAEPSEAAAAPDGGDGEPAPVVETAGRLESIVESLLYAAERPLTVNELKRLVNERDGKKVAAALEALRERHADTGIQLASLAGGWQFRTHPDNGPWVAKLVAGRPQRLTRAMLETLAIVAYRQPITRPEIDDIRGVDCGPVLKTLLDRGFIRILGKKEDVGRPMLYGTTADFLKTFSLKDLSELPTLREFHELSEQQMAAVDAQAPLVTGADAAGAEGAAGTGPGETRSPFAPAPLDLAPVDQAEEDELLGALDAATMAASRASGPPPGQGAEAAPAEPGEAQS